ncbi:MAG: hypothetical protein IPK44_04610 [Candidatus Accumulibacter sp.]|uniref:hypothetical protein n=1 Tax=Accumulibacter sp. TaxID=2053492 RepID=UPI002590B70A|nr:hypothetical protein [Accumulibacter sp.]MBK8113870.1 hypothetical protein [Accumulibacter sp.]
MENRSNGKQDMNKEPSRKTNILHRLAVGLITLVIVWFLIGGRVSYAISECSNGVGRCLMGVAVTLGIVDVYDKHDRCIGLGCNY